MGIDPSVMGQKLQVVDDTDWAGFTDKTIAAFDDVHSLTPNGFYKQHFGVNALRNVVDWISDTQTTQK